MKFRFIILPLMALLIAGCNDLSDQVEVRTEPEAYYDAWSDSYRYHHYITVTSLSNDAIHVDNISINRGACPTKVMAGSTVLTSYSSQVKYQVYNCSTENIREVQLKLNGDDYVYNFN